MRCWLQTHCDTGGFSPTADLDYTRESLHCLSSSAAGCERVPRSCLIHTQIFHHRILCNSPCSKMLWNWLCCICSMTLWDWYRWSRRKVGVSQVDLHPNAMSSLKTGRTDASCFSRIRESVGFSRSMWPCGPRGMTHRSWILSSTCTYTFCATFVLWTRVNRVFSYITLIPSSCHIFNLPVVDQIKNAFS